MLALDSVPAAGGLVIDQSEKILFIFKDGRWDLPKGLIDRNGKAHHVAIREVAEETGLPLAKLRSISELVPTAHISKFGKRRALKTIRWFLIQYLGERDPFEPQIQEGVEHCEWIPIWDLERPLGNCPSRIRYLVSFWLKARQHIKADGEK